jgi:hypothetical protein
MKTEETPGLIGIVNSILDEALKYKARFVCIDSTDVWIQTETGESKEKISLTLWVGKNLLPSIRARLRIMAQMSIADHKHLLRGEFTYGPRRRGVNKKKFSAICVPACASGDILILEIIS